MASMAATSRWVIGTLESIPSSPGLSVSVRNQVPRVINQLKGRATVKSRNVGCVKIRAISSSSSASGMEEAVKKTISENAVVVYSKTWCGYSSRVKSLFKKLGVEPLIVELDELGAQGSKLQRTLEKLTGQGTVPNVFIGGKHIGGCSDTVELHQNGQLQPLLAEAGAIKLN